MDDNIKEMKKKIREKRKKDPSFIDKLKKKIKKLKKEDPNIYPMN